MYNQNSKQNQHVNVTKLNSHIYKQNKFKINNHLIKQNNHTCKRKKVNNNSKNLNSI